MRRWVQSAALGVLMALTLTACYQGQALPEGEGQSGDSLAQLVASPSPNWMPSASPAPLMEDNSAIVLVGENATVQEESTPIPQGTAVAQAQADTWSLTATAYVALITQTQVISLTQTAQALGIGITPTAAPTLAFETPTLPPQVLPTATVFGGGGAVVPSGVCVHEVRQGDNLFRMSLYYGLPINDIALANGIANIQLIVVGQKLNIPGCGTTGNLPPPTSIPLSTATSNFGTGGPLTTPAPATGFGGTTHIVQQYETLFIISQRYGVSVNSIAAANGITNINMVIIGQQLTIPAQ